MNKNKIDKKLLSAKNDFIFKLIFGNDKNKDILSNFLQSILNIPTQDFEQLTIVDPHLRQETIDDKLGILDVKIHTKTGKIINIEIQVLNIPEMKERILFYTSKMITGQISKGQKYSIKNVIMIVITDYKLINDSFFYHNKYYLHDKHTHSQFSDIIEIHILELVKLPKYPDKTNLWNWMKFFDAKTKEDFEMIKQENPQIEKAVEILEDLSQDEQTRLLYEQREKAIRDYNSCMEGSFEKGEKSGIEKGKLQGMVEGERFGLEKGKIEGEQIGIQKGKLEGKLEQKIEMAKSLKQNGVDIKIIALSSGLTEEEIKNL